MSRQLLVFFAIGLVVIGVLVASVFYVQRGAHLVVKGGILKIRTMPLDDASSLAVVDFRVENLSDVSFSLRNVEVTAVLDNGEKLPGSLIARSDVNRLFEIYRILGSKYNETFTTLDNIPPRKSIDRMLAVRFEKPEPQIQNRKAIRLHFEDMAHAVVDLGEKR